MLPFYAAALDTPSRLPAYEELTSTDIAAAAAAGAHVILVTGATEQHGPQLPLGADTMQGTEMARRAACILARDGIDLLVGPAIPFGPKAFLSEAPADFPGTLNLSHATLKALIEEILHQLVAQGFRHLYLLTAHAESDPVNQIVAKEVSETTEASVVTLNWLVGARPGYDRLRHSERPQGHAGEGEVARLLVTAPHLVRRDQGAPFHPALPEATAPHDKLPYLGGAIGRYKYPQEVFAGFQGTWGDPANGTAEMGEATYAHITDWICQAIRAEHAIWRPTPS